MLNLIIKDILVQKKTLLFALGYCFFLVFAFQTWRGNSCRRNNGCSLPFDPVFLRI